MPLWSRGQKGVALMRFGGGDGAVCLVLAVRMWERTCALELLGSVASIQSGRVRVCLRDDTTMVVNLCSVLKLKLHRHAKMEHGKIAAVL